MDTKKKCISRTCLTQNQLTECHTFACGHVVCLHCIISKKNHCRLCSGEATYSFDQFLSELPFWPFS